MKTLLQWIGATATALIALAIISPPVAAQLNRVSPRQIICGAGLMLSGGSGGMACGTQALFGDGTVAAPSIAFAAQPGVGIRRPGSNMIDFQATAAAPFVRFQGTLGMILPSNLEIGFASTVSAAGNVDTLIQRGGIGELNYSTVAFSALGTPADGTMALCTDCGPVTAASCPGTKASCVCAAAGGGSVAIRIASTWYCPF